MKIIHINKVKVNRKDSLPDVDIDFEANEREKVKQHIYEKFGKLHTCSIGSYTRLKLKAGIKDFGRARELGFTYCNNVTRDIDNQLEYTWKDLIDYAIKSDEVKRFIQKYPEIAHCIKFSLGQARSASIHASAVIIVPKQDFKGNDVNIFNWVPIRKIEGTNVSEWEGKYCDKAGFLKEDILSLNQLDKFKRIIQLIDRNHDLVIDLNDIPLDDENTYMLFSRGMNTDVFQFNSKGLKTYSKQVRPNKFEDLVAMNALYRPGPMGSNAHIDFALIKHGKKKPKYDYLLDEVTKTTYGLYVYQEQIMKAFVTVGFTPVEADIIRTTIKKFDKVKMGGYKEEFIKKYSALSSLNSAEAEKVWNKLVSFSSYGFNKCITGDMNIYRFTGNQHLPKVITVKTLYDLSTKQNTPIYDKFKKQGHLGLVRYYNQELNKVQYQKVKAVHFNGNRHVFKILLANGMFAVCTANHRWLSVEGYKMLKNLKIGEELICCGDKIEDYAKSYKPTGEGHDWIRNYGNKIGNIKDGRAAKFENSKSNALLRSKNKCEECGVDAYGRMEFHHKDGNNLNHEFNNLMYVCNSCHKKLDYKLGLKNGKRDQGFLAIKSKIVSIEYVGKEDVFDLEMFEEPHNFIANGIVSHNSHSAAYALIAYYSQWLKSNFPLEFWTASLNFAREGDDESIPNRICEIGKLKQGIKIKPPDINNSGIEFDCDHETQTIYWSLMKIKGLGDASVKKILNERIEKGNFLSYDNFVDRVPKKDINKKSVLTLILSGAFDEVENIEEPTRRIDLVKKHFQRLKENLPEEYKGNLIYKTYSWILTQRELTGFGDIDYRSLLIKNNHYKLADRYISPDLFVNSKKNRKEVVVCGKVIYNKIKLSKNKKEYASINIQCNNEEISILIWESVIDEGENRKFIEECGGKIIAFSGQMNYDDVRLYNCVYSYDDTVMVYL